MVWRRVGTLVVARPARAQEILNIMTGMNPQQQNGGEAQHIFGVTCRKGHVTYFDKRRVCTKKGRVVRDPETKLDELILECGQCGDEMLVRVDCEGY